MDFTWPEEYINYKKEVISFASRELVDDLKDRDRQGAFSKENWLKCADFGLQGLSLPTEYGGSMAEPDFLRAMLAMEGFGFGCKDNGLSLGLNAQMWTVQKPILDFGSDDQKRRFLPSLADGSKIACHALTEKDAGSDVFGMHTAAERVEGGYILSGTKRLITFAPLADLVLVFAYTKPKLKKWGVSAFIVEAGTDGFRSGEVQSKMGLRTVPIGELYFENCFIPDVNRLGSEGMGFSILNHSLEYDRCSILASQLGAMERQLEDTIAFVKQREQFGQKISKFQSVSNRIANMKLRLETSRLLLYKVAWLKSQGKPAMQEAAMLKLHLGESFLESSMDAIRARGGEGYLSEFEVERDLRDAVGGVLYAGTSDIQRNIIASLLGL